MCTAQYKREQTPHTHTVQTCLNLKKKKSASVIKNHFYKSVNTRQYLHYTKQNVYKTAVCNKLIIK